MRRVGLLLVSLAVPLTVWAQDGGVPNVAVDGGVVDAGVPDAGAVAYDPAAAAAFVDVVRVLQSPRCVNCHPTGDVPLNGDDARPHPMQVARGFERVGMSCQTCHRATPVSMAPGIPPAVPGWAMPHKETPMVFQGRTARQICEQIKDPAQNGGKDLAGLLHHVEADALVLYGWNPGGDRTQPPMSHAEFVGRFKTWVQAGGPCP